jgi:hypothetical protein
MRLLCRMSPMVLGFLLGVVPVGTCGEEEVLTALDGVQAGIEEGVSQKRLAELLDDAKGQVDGLRKGVGNVCFRAAATRCYMWYAHGVSSWGSMIANQERQARYARQAEFGEDHLREANRTVADNYGRLVQHARDALPSKWTAGQAELEKAHQCLAGQTMEK